MSMELLTILLFSGMVVLLVLGFPISFCLGGVAVVFGYFLWGYGGLQTVSYSVLNTMRTIILMAVPLFIFMGNMMERSGLADDLYAMMYRWFGPVRGGLAIGTVLICTIFAAMTGISGAATVTMGLIALPSMLKRGYNKNIAIGSISAGGALGILIPPSVIMIIYAFLASESVGRLFAGGVVPGLLLASMFIIYIIVRCGIRKEMGPALPQEERASWREKLVSLRAVILPIVLVIMVLGSIFSGFATPTEASAIGAVGAIVCAAILRKLSWQNLKEACLSTIKLSSMVLWIVIGAAYFTTIYTAIGAPKLIETIILALPVETIFVIVGMQLTFFILGMFMDPTGIVMITAPVFVPVVMALGFDSVWFGVLFVMNMEMGYLTPPFGYNLFYMKGVVPKGITMGDIYRSIVPFVIIQGLALAIVLLFPQIVLWLPNLMFGTRTTLVT